MRLLQKFSESVHGSAPRALAATAVILVLGACARGPSGEMGEEAQRQLHSPALMVVNGLSEDFSLLRDLDSPPHLRQLNRSVKYVSDRVAQEVRSAGGEISCRAVNHVARSRGYFYLTCSLSNAIHVFREEGLKLERVIDLGDHVNPWEIALVEGGKAYVTSYLRDEIWVIHSTPERMDRGERVIRKISLREVVMEADSPDVPGSARPQGMRVVGGKLYVALGNLGPAGAAGPGYVAVIDTATDQVIRVIQAGGRNVTSVYHSDLPGYENLVFVTRAGTYAAGPSGGGFVGDGGVDVIEASTDRITRSVPLPGAPFEMVLGENGIGYVSNGKEGKLLVFDATLGRSLPAIDVTAALAAGPCGGSATAGILSYVSSLALYGTSLYFTEFNSNCLLSYDWVTEKIHSQWKTGEGPDVMVVLER